MPGDFTWTAECAPVCELGLSDVREPEPDSWMDVSCFVHECEIATGRERFSDRFEPGTASITFDNRSGWGDLVGSPSVVATQKLRPGRPMRVGMDGPWGRRWLFRGWIDRCVPTYDPVLHDIVTVECIDALGEAGTAVAPTGPLVGANETVDVRLNRVLDAVGWFPTKRTIGTSTTTVTATTFGSRAIDHMSQAADSAGGVVYGDLSGNVVYRDIGWELFDPDVPPDGTIGNVDPGTPGEPFVPGYIDPVPGYVYDPDPPPITSRTVVKVCSDGTEGVLVEQGDGFRIEAKDGRLLFESSGHFWDLGPFEGGCVAVAFDPDTGGVDRWDDPEGDDVWEIAPLPPILLPPTTPVVELVAFSQGGLDEEPFSTVNIPFAPGPDCLIVIQCLGIDNIDPDATEPPYALDPAFTCPGVELFDNQWYSSSYGHVAQAYMQFGRVGRDDPGAVTLHVDFGVVEGLGINANTAAVAHFIAIWAVRDCDPKVIEGSSAYPWNSEPAYGEVEMANAGKGPVSIPMYSYEGSRIPALGPHYATVACSLAEETTAPFDATFAEAVWVDPPITLGVTKKVSWSTGIRFGGEKNLVDWSEINTGPTDEQSTCAVFAVPTTRPIEFGAQLLDWRVQAPHSGTITGGGHMDRSMAPGVGSLLVCFVTATADHDMVDDIDLQHWDHPTVTLTRQHTRHKTGSSWGQGAIYTMVVPEGRGLDDFGGLTLFWGTSTIQSVALITWEVVNPDPGTPVGAVASGVLGDGTPGSVNGPWSFPLSTTPAEDWITLAALHVAGTVDITGSGTHSGGDEWIEELDYAEPFYRAYWQSQKRMPPSTDTAVEWNDVQTGTAAMSSAVGLGIGIRPGPDFVMFPDDGSPLVIGGEFNAFNGPIFSAERRDGLDPNTGDVVWSLAPLDVVVP